VTAGIVLALVTAQRLAELWLASRNSRRILARGGREFGRSHYPLIVAVHGLWLGALWWLAPGRPIHWLPLVLFLLLQFARLWVIRTLGDRWTTRIIVVPGEPLVRRGPYLWLNHPNYLIVALEIALLPLAFGLVELALIFTLLNAAALTVRIRSENKALALCAPPP
jgi:methyltransferase